ncbi:type IV pilus biogenesis/stability protein PilW [Aquabacterium sp.]|jgi:type IV pilus assembly protein PilF|uniref:type IV pilus biogenesis/stability protein PilW n=1 Tax=Aquabacterium sp. TaxID=1872578 RepID=UPI0025C0E54E|nr:type IV pilus biogenesis/stability protein PilW [Aquabacterium sp.]
MRVFRVPGPVGLLLLSLVLGLTSLMSGCAGQTKRATTQAASVSRGDIATASDENDQRKRARIRLELASTYYAQGKYTTALDELKQALAIDASLPSAYELRALIYGAMGDQPRAESSFKQALALDARDGSVLHNYAWYLCQLGEYNEADALFERAAVAPQGIATSKTLLARGVCQIKADRHAEAEKTLARSYELDPANPATAYNMAALLYRRGELERARFYIRRVNGVPEQLTAESLWLAVRIEHKLNNTNGRDELAAQLRSRFPSARETTALELGRFDE